MKKLLLITLSSLLLISACGKADPTADTADKEVMQKEIKDTVKDVTRIVKKEADKAGMNLAADSDNLLLAEWEGPFQGVPAFDKVKVENLKQALELAMAKSLKDIDAIANNPEPPTFANTMEALERSGPELDRVFTYYGIWSSNKSSPEFREIQREMAPKLSEYSSKIRQNKKLLNRLKAVYDSRNDSGLRDDQKRVIELSYEGFVHGGATLEGEKKDRFAEIQKELSELHTKFGNNVLHDEESYVLYLTKDQLGGLSESFINSAAAIAKENGKQGMYAITNTRSSMSPFLTYSTERDLRKKVWETYYNRGNNNDEYDNKKVIADILKLRHERVGLMGYKNYATWRLENRMAKNPENALELMEAVWPAAIGRVDEEVADMQAIADKEGAKITIEPWDYRFYAEKVRADKYDLNSDEVKQYLQQDKLVQAMFYVAGELFDFKFDLIDDGSVPVFHKDVTVYEVTKKSSGKHVGLWYFDPFARKGKRSGAWATTYRSRSTFDGEKNVLASNNSNFVKAAPGEAVLISWDDANTLFHEFGHALHFLAADVAYPTLQGGVRDYTEFQSQLLERWLSTDAVIDNYLVHHETGKTIPDELVKKIKAAATFNQGFATTEYLASALMDMRYHTSDPEGLDVAKFEKENLLDLNMPKELPMRHRSTHFGHIFSGEGYSSGYYGYIWADVLTSDASEAFKEAPGGFYDKKVAANLVNYLFAPRNSIDPAEAYRLFRGRDAKIEALMRDRGFPIPEKD